MNKIILNSEIIFKHALYINKRGTSNKLSEFLNDDKVINWIKKNKDNNFYNEHCKFINFIIRQANEISNFTESMEIKANLFIGTPKELNNFIKIIEKNFPNMCREFQKDEEFMTEYKEKIINILGYNDFISNHDLSIYYYEDKLFNLFNSKAKINRYLKENKKNKSVKVYNEDDYQNILRYFGKKVDKIIDARFKDVEIKKLLVELKEKLQEINCKIKKAEFIEEFFPIIEEFDNKYKRIKKNSVCLTIKEYDFNKQIKRFDIYQWGAYHYIFSLGLKVCPYCNRQYITPLYTEEGKVRADLDHFFPKSKYPYLAMSIYNLVPCCKFCNSSLKSDKEFSYSKNLNPFELGISEVLEFDFIPISYDSFYGDGEIKILLNNKENVSNDKIDKARNNCNIFKVEELYQYHSDIIKKLILKKLIYSEDYIEFICKKYNKLISSKEEAIDFLMSPYLKIDDLDQPLSILIKDILKNLKM